MAKTKGKTANIFVWIILFLLIVGLAGFGLDGFGGTVRSIGKVGDREIPVQDYHRALQQEIRAVESELGQSLSMQEIRNLGVDQAVLGQVVRVAALENETMRLGVSVGDSVVQRELLDQPAFRGISGNFDRETYRFILQREGLSESEFEERLRFETARSLLQTAIVAGISAPREQADAIYQYIGERRSFDVYVLDRNALDTAIPAPTDEELRRFHQDNLDQFTRPAARALTYAWVTPRMLQDLVEIGEEDLREAYESRIGEYVQPERRLVERLVYSDEQAARAAMARIEDGSADFSDLVAERGLEMEDADMGDVSRAQLGDAAGNAVFALDAPGVVGPFDTPLGPALFRMNGILAAQETTFEEALPELRDELSRDRARRMIAEQIDYYEDLLAGGATIEDLANETDMELGQIAYTSGDTEGIATHEEFRMRAEEISEGAFPEIHALENGGLFTLRLDGERPPEPIPFDEVQVRVIEAWERAQILERLEIQADALMVALETGIEPDEGAPVPQRVEGITRNDFVPDLPREVISAAFRLGEGESRTLRGDAEVYVLSLSAVMSALTGTPETDRLQALLAEQIEQGVAQDVFTYFARALEGEAGIQLNQAVITAVHEQLR